MSDTPPQRKPRIVFFGTPVFAVTVLEEIRATDAYDIVGVVTETDKPAGRGQKLRPPAVKEYALAHAIPVLQPESLRGLSRVEDADPPQLVSRDPRSEGLATFLNQHAPIDIFVIVAYGKIIPRVLLNFPPFGMINVHGSLLPRWRGAAPIHRALFAGDTHTGVCVMQTAYELDTGPVYLSEELPITERDTFGSLHDAMAVLGGKAICKALPGILDSSLPAVPQSEEGITYAEKWQKEDLLIRWEEPAEQTLRRIRTCAPTPGARTNKDGTLVKIFAAHLQADQNFPKAEPGTVVETNHQELIVAAGTSQYISVDELQIAGKTRMPVAEVLRGNAIKVGDRFTS